MRYSIVLLGVFAAAFVGEPAAHAQAGRPVRVFILAGQSNMVGHGKTEMGRKPGTHEKGKSAVEVKGGLGSLRHMVNAKPEQFGPDGKAPLVDADGNWLERDDVMMYVSIAGRTPRIGPHKPGYGQSPSWIGPEYGFGRVVGEAIDDDVLIIKYCTGGTSLYKDWRSPTAVQKRGGEVGPMWTGMLKEVEKVVADLGKVSPRFKDRPHQFVGFGWHQGWNDGGSADHANQYKDNMTDFIADVRATYGKDLPFVIATTGMGGGWKIAGRRLTVIEAQLAMAKIDHVAVVETRGFWRPADQSPSNFGYHWNHNAYSHFEMGAAMGEAMVKLLGE